MERIAKQLTENYDWYLAIVRGGLMPTLLLAQITGQKKIDTLCLSSYQEKKKAQVELVEKNYYQLRGMKVLMIDDLSDSGETLTVATIFLLSHCQPKLLHTACPIVKASSRFAPTYSIKQMPDDKWIEFQYEKNQRAKDFIYEELI